MYTGVGTEEARGANCSPNIFVWGGPNLSKNWVNAIYIYSEYTNKPKLESCLYLPLNMMYNIATAVIIIAIFI